MVFKTLVETNIGVTCTVTGHLLYLRTRFQELRAQLEPMEHLWKTTSDDLDSALTSLPVSDENDQRALLSQTRRRLSEQAVALHSAEEQHKHDLDWLAARVEATLAEVDPADELAPALAALQHVHDQLAEFERWASRAPPSPEHDNLDRRLRLARDAARATRLRHEVSAKLTSLIPVRDQLAIVRAAEMTVYRRIMLLELLQKGGGGAQEDHLPQLQVEVTSLTKAVNSLRKKHPQCHALEVSRFFLVTL